ncbi:MULTISPECIES: helix-turn-helix domain-containing protein [Coprobacillaceae]|uniref:helix-turn-helix domain-containing protein n=1 Tax=Coprobacillaceae TaxID=2810280 RepID=UPI0018F428A8|nr:MULTISPECIES: helix-turn-helix transcriptional regulator [Coprobacillaceae]
MKVEVKFGQRLKDIRNNQNISQEELSFRCGLSKNYISDVERGTRNISLQAIEKLAKGLQVSIKELFDFKEDE